MYEFLESAVCEYDRNVTELLCLPNNQIMKVLHNEWCESLYNTSRIALFITLRKK